MWGSHDRVGRMVMRKYPFGRFAILVLASVAMLIAALADASDTRADPEFGKFIEDLWPLAAARGVSRKTFDAAFKDVTFDATVVAHTKSQPEFVIPIWQYLATAVYQSRIVRGRAKSESEHKWLVKARIEYEVVYRSS